jgi:F0F1-type ATP synthase assembly protein I
LTISRRLPKYAFAEDDERWPMEEPREKADQFRSAARIYQLVSEFVAPIVFGLLVDWGFGTKPWATLAGTLAGLLIGGIRVAQLVRRMSESDLGPK